MSDWFEGSGGGAGIEVAEVMGDQADDLVKHLVQTGALVSLGRTSDGGALGVTVTLDGRYRREYFRATEELVAWLMGAAEAVEAEVERLAASSAPRKRPRRA